MIYIVAISRYGENFIINNEFYTKMLQIILFLLMKI